MTLIQYLSESMCMCAWSDRMELSARAREMDWDGELRCARERDGCRMHVRVARVKFSYKQHVCSLTFWITKKSLRGGGMN